MPLIIRSFMESEGGGGQSMHVDTLTITTQPSKKTYIQGERIDTTGMVVTASAYGMSGTVTPYVTVSPQILSTAGTQTVTVSFGDATATYTVTVEEIVSLTITTQPTKTDYIQGESLDLTGMVVTATSANLNRNVTSDCTFEPANGSTISTTGSTTVTVSFGGMTDTTTVTSYAITGIEITTPPTKTSYLLDDELDLTGIVVSAIAGTLTSDVTNQCTFNPVDGTVLDTAGTFTLTASWNGFSDTLSLNVSAVSILENTDWATIKGVGTNGTGSQYWSIGDTKTITLNGTVGTVEFSNYQCKVFIIDFNYRGENGIYFQGFKSMDSTPIDIALYDGINTKTSDGSKVFNMMHWGDSNYGGWKGCDLRYDILGSTDVAPSGYGAKAVAGRSGYDATNTCTSNPVSNTLMSALSSDLRAVLAPWTVYTDNVGNKENTQANITTSIDYLPLLAEYEVYGSTNRSNTYEAEEDKQKQMTYYASGNSKYKAQHSNTSAIDFRWWERSPYKGDSAGYCDVRGSSSDYYSASKTWGLAPAFRVA